MEFISKMFCFLQIRDKINVLNLKLFLGIMFKKAFFFQFWEEH